MKRQQHRTGYTFRDPNGELDFRIVQSPEAAQSNAAFACERPYSHIEMPDDWGRAYKQGFRIVSATLVGGRSQTRWKRLQRERD